MNVSVGPSTFRLVVGDITTQAVDAVVNAANADLRGGGGVDGAIHRAAGPAVLQETGRRKPEGCPTGSAVISSAGDLHARHIIHAVGPIWDGGRDGEEALLRSAYRHSLRLAVENDCRTVALPAISCGVYGYPLDLAAAAAVDEVGNCLAAGPPLDVRFVLFSEGVYAAFHRAAESRFNAAEPE